MWSSKPVFKRMLIPFSTLSIALLSVSSCNVFDPLDSPGNDAQYLSAARACFDRGDFDCASKYYAMLSDPYADTVNAEQSFMTLDKQGASMAAYMEFIGNLTENGFGSALTAFANRLTGGAGAEKRQTIWNIYNAANTGKITNPDLKNFVVFISSLALVGEILAETAQGNSSLLPSDIATSSSVCTASTTACGAGAATCNPPSGSTLKAAAAPLIQSANPDNAVATTRQLYDMIDKTVTTMSALGAAGRFSGAVTSFNSISSAINLVGGSAALDTPTSMPDQCFRHTLLSLGVGTL